MTAPSNPEAHPLGCLTEADVRERIIWPLLQRLGFSPETVTTERPLIYTRLFLGRKKGQHDRPLRGTADYVCEVDGRLRFVVEAKKPGEISEDHREQAYSYAAHPEIRAPIFAVISGSYFEFYLTFQNPEAGPLLRFTYLQQEERFLQLKNIVSPAAMRRDFPAYVADTGEPLGSGLKSFAKVVGGKQTYSELPAMSRARLGSSVHFTGGSLVRMDTLLVLQLIPSHTEPKTQEFARRQGITELTLISTAPILSTDPDHPTIFTSRHSFVIEQGTDVPDPERFNAAVPAPASGSFEADAILSVYLNGNTLRGAVEAHPVDEQGTHLATVRAELELELSCR